MMRADEEKRKIRLKHQIMTILELYSPLIGGVPLRMLEYHLHHIPYENSRGEVVRDSEGGILVDDKRLIDYTPDELRVCLQELLLEGRLSRDVVAYKAVK